MTSSVRPSLIALEETPACGAAGIVESHGSWQRCADLNDEQEKT